MKIEYPLSSSVNESVTTMKLNFTSQNLPGAMFE